MHMFGTAKPSAKLIIGGMLLAAVFGPSLALVGLFTSVAAAAEALASFSLFEESTGVGGGGGGAGVLLMVLGFVVVLVGMVLVILGLYNFLSTFDAIGRKYLAPSGSLGRAYGELPAEAAPQGYATGYEQPGGGFGEFPSGGHTQVYGQAYPQVPQTPPNPEPTNRPDDPQTRH